MIVVTGSEGFIGKALCDHFSTLDYRLIRVDKENTEDAVESGWLLDQESDFWRSITHVVHLGAISDTRAALEDVLEQNLIFSIKLFEICRKYDIPFIYASSASVYGNSLEFSETKIRFNRLNYYSMSKSFFDFYVTGRMNELSTPVIGLRFFNVYGPTEYKKGGMASPVTTLAREIILKKEATIFDIPGEYSKGRQSRDYVYIDDVLHFINHLLNKPPKSGIYNLGTGLSTSMNELVKVLSDELGISPKVSFFSPTQSIIDSYQLYTKANLNLNKNSQLPTSRVTLREGIQRIHKENMFGLIDG